MPKATLSREEMKRLSGAGLSMEEVAAVAGVNPTYAKVRLSSEKTDYTRRTSKARYTNQSHSERRKYLEIQRNRNRSAQAESKKTAEVFGEWRAEEIHYLENFGTGLTALELAKNLRRTYFSVKKAAERYGISLRIG